MKNKTDRSRLLDPQIIKITDTVSMIIITFHGRINILIGGGDSRISGSLERVREIVSTYNPQNYESLDRSFLELQHQKRLELRNVQFHVIRDIFPLLNEPIPLLRGTLTTVSFLSRTIAGPHGSRAINPRCKRQIFTRSRRKREREREISPRNFSPTGRKDRNRAPRRLEINSPFRLAGGEAGIRI